MNDAYDNAQTDKEILAKIEADFAAERAAKEAAGPQLGLAPGVCGACKGTGVGEAIFEYDEHNPTGYWETEPCGECHGSGLSKGVNDELDRLVFAERDLDLCRKHLDLLDTKTDEWKKMLDEMPQHDGPHYGDALEETMGKMDDVVGAVSDEIDETRNRVWPEPVEPE